MKKSATKTTILVMIAVVSVLMAAQIAKAGLISGTKHDLSSGNTSAGAIISNKNDVCVFCHTPHGASTTNTTPLWNRTASAATYTLYSGTMKAATAQPAGVSAACLSCHDGTVALDSLIKKPTGLAMATSTKLTTSMLNNTSNGLLGTDLSNDHPISIIYGQNSAPNLVAKSTVTATLKLYGTAGSETVECASCHSVHDNANAPFLRISNAGSALCLTCHIK